MLPQRWKCRSRYVIERIRRTACKQQLRNPALVIQRTIRHLVNLVMRDACIFTVFCSHRINSSTCGSISRSASFRVIQFEPNNCATTSVRMSNNYIALNRSSLILLSTIELLITRLVINCEQMPTNFIVLVISN